MHGHLDHLIVETWGLAGSGIVKQPGGTASGALAAAVALLAWQSLAMSHNFRPLAGGTVPDVGHHSTSRSDGSFGSSNMRIKNSRSITVGCVANTAGDLIR